MWRQHLGDSRLGPLNLDFSMTKEMCAAWWEVGKVV